MRVALKIVFLFFFVTGLTAEELRFFPQIGDGTAMQFQLKTSFLFVNTGEDAQIQLDFLDSDGNPLELELAPYGKKSSFTIPLASGNTASGETPGTGPLQVGYARFAAPATVGGTAVFTGVDAPSGTVLFEAGVPATSAGRSFSLMLDSIGTARDTGLAVVAPPASAGGTAGNFTLALSDEQNRPVGSCQVPITPGKKISKYVYEFLKDFGGDQTAADRAKEMRGRVSVTCPTPLAAVTLRQTVAPPFPAGVSTLTAFPVVEGAEWQLVWADEFEGTAVDTTKWNYDIGVGQNGWGNNELEYYTDRTENSRVENGKLIITAQKETNTANFQGRQYTSARMKTNNKGDWKYGRIEVRAKLPSGQGIWPAIWMMPTDSVYGGWAASGEIDIMEYLGHETNKIYATLHYGGAWPNNRSSGAVQYVLRPGQFPDDYHTFAFEWEAEAMRWYVDGKLFATQTNWYTTGQPYPAPFDQRFYLILNLAVGGNWPGAPNASTVFPQKLEVDYVRVYQKAN